MVSRPTARLDLHPADVHETGIAFIAEMCISEHAGAPLGWCLGKVGVLELGAAAGWGLLVDTQRSSWRYQSIPSLIPFSLLN